MANLHICDKEICPETSTDITTNCFVCGKIVFLPCFGIALRANSYFKPGSFVQFICPTCQVDGEIKIQTNEHELNDVHNLMKRIEDKIDVIKESVTAVPQSSKTDIPLNVKNNNKPSNMNAPTKLSTLRGTSNINFDGSMITTPETNIPKQMFNRMIWVGNLGNEITTEILTTYIEKKLDIDSTNKIVLRPLIAKDKSLSDYTNISYKISVDSLETFESLIDTDFWPRTCRIREFFDRRTEASSADFLSLETSKKKLNTTINLMEH